MTRNVKLIGLLLVLLIAGNGCSFAHRKISEKMDKAKMKRESRFMGRNHMGPGGQFMFNDPMNGRRGQMRSIRGMRGGNMQMPMYGMGRGRGQMGMNLMGRGPMGPDNMIGRIPNLTEKQRKDIADLRLKQMEELDKFREQTAAKIQSMREENRKKMLNLLTDEQKKFLESLPANTNPVPIPAPAK